MFELQCLRGDTQQNFFISHDIYINIQGTNKLAKINFQHQKVPHATYEAVYQTQYSVEN